MSALKKQTKTNKLITTKNKQPKKTKKQKDRFFICFFQFPASYFHPEARKCDTFATPLETLGNAKEDSLAGLTPRESVIVLHIVKGYDNQGRVMRVCVCLLCACAFAFYCVYAFAFYARVR